MLLALVIRCSPNKIHFRTWIKSCPLKVIKKQGLGGQILGPLSSLHCGLGQLLVSSRPAAPQAKRRCRFHVTMEWRDSMSSMRTNAQHIEQEGSVLLILLGAGAVTQWAKSLPTEPTWTLVQFLAATYLIHLPAPGKPAEDGSRVWAPEPMWEILELMASVRTSRGLCSFCTVNQKMKDLTLSAFPSYSNTAYK